MLYFQNDYLEGAHPQILEALIKTNHHPLPGYGTDIFSLSAKEKIRQACACPQADVEFLVGGTQTNAIIIDTLLDSTEGVIAASSGHISVHEAGAIEFTGHKVLTLPHTNGKISARQIKTYLENFYQDPTHSHMVYPGMVYLTYPTEYGTLYSKDELKAIRSVCEQYEIPLMIDGARLIYALNIPEADLTLADIAQLCDVFYIGGTKAGLLCGEAVVFTRQNKPKRWTTKVKQHLGLLAKGRLLSVQFDALFTDDLYLKIAHETNRATQALKRILHQKGYEFYLNSPTNQQFIKMTQETLNTISQDVQVDIFEPLDANTYLVRFTTSWSTQLKDIERLSQVL